MYASQPGVGVHPANSYRFIIILSPVGAYYPEGVNLSKSGLKMNMLELLKVGQVLQNVVETMLPALLLK